MGTSSVFASGNDLCMDHPHAYGDKFGNNIRQAKHKGSSPRVWGQGISAVGIMLENGIIPTRMGTRVFRFGGNCVEKDHPHAYGDKPFILIVSPTLTGSSPRVWGQDYHQTSELL